MYSFIRTFIIAVIIFTGIGFAAVERETIKTVLFPPSSEAAPWQAYTSSAFDFEITVPADWTVVEFPNDEIAPRVNMYPSKYTKTLITNKDGIDRTTPITHHSDIPQVSIFPQGVPTEGFFGEFVESDVLFAEKTRSAHDFTLANGSRFATFAAFADAPPSWSEAGFIWSRADVSFMRSKCFRGDRRLPLKQCDPLTGDAVVYRGTLNKTDRDIQKKILESFSFTEHKQ